MCASYSSTTYKAHPSKTKHEMDCEPRHESRKPWSETPCNILIHVGGAVDMNFIEEVEDNRDAEDGVEATEYHEWDG
jgi:hypothetical protein